MAEKVLRNREDKASERRKNLISVNQHFAEIERLDELYPVMLDLAKSITEAEVAVVGRTNLAGAVELMHQQGYR